MVNSHDPALAMVDEWGMVMLSHIFCGLFLWEFFTTLDYEWAVFRGYIPYRWTIWIYSITRIASLISVILNVVGIDMVTQVNCQLWKSVLVAFTYLAMATASLLIVLRVIAVWNRNKVIVVMATGVWGINAVFLIEGAARLHSKWVPPLFVCMDDTNPTNVPTFFAMTVTDTFLLLIMLIGLLRLRHGGGGTFGLAHFLWKQGLIWLLLTTVTEITPSALLVLNLSSELNHIFQIPCVVIMSVSATRMHRSLVHFAHRPSDTVENVQVTRLKFATIKPSRTTTTSLNAIEMTAHTVLEQHPTPLTTDHDLPVNADKDVREQPSGLCFDKDIERGQATD